MAEINVVKNAVEIRSELKKNGTKIEYIVVDGQKIGILGSVNEADRAAAIDAINKAYIASGGNIIKMIVNLSTIANIEERNIDPNEMIEVEGKDIIISYSNAKAYTMSGDVIASCDDLPDMPKEAIKVILIERVKNVI